MKLPRWLVIAMLTSSLLAVLAAAGWWWVTWPERTAREFAQLLPEGDWRRARTMLVTQDDHVVCHTVGGVHLRSAWIESSISFEPRGLPDVIARRHDFTLTNRRSNEVPSEIVLFTAIKDKVKRRPLVEDDLERSPRL